MLEAALVHLLRPRRIRMTSRAVATPISISTTVPAAFVDSTCKGTQPPSRFSATCSSPIKTLALPHCRSLTSAPPIISRLMKWACPPSNGYETTWRATTQRAAHTNMDTYDHVLEDDLKQSAAVAASLIYHLAMRDERIPRKSLPSR